LEKSVQIKRELSEKLKERQLREQKLIETKTRYEKNVEEFKHKLSYKLESINDKVKTQIFIIFF
jgi:hypothetical protein